MFSRIEKTNNYSHSNENWCMCMKSINIIGFMVFMIKASLVCPTAYTLFLQEPHIQAFILKWNYEKLFFANSLENLHNSRT